MKLVIALDCDGTMDTSNGPVSVKRMTELAASQEVKIYMVSGSASCTNTPFDRRAILADRTESLRKVRELEPSGTLFVYISDNLGDDGRAWQTGFVYVHPKDFRLPET